MKILVVDDEAMQRDFMAGFLRQQGHEVLLAASGEEGLALLKRTPVDLLLVDQTMPGMSGSELLRHAFAFNPQQAAIMITAYGAVETAVEVMKLGALDFLEKPVDLAQLKNKLEELDEKRLVEEDASALKDELEERELPLPIVGRGEKMLQLLSLVRRLAPSPWTVLIRGETGTGKELIARLIHQLSPRGEKPFVEVNCAALPENLFESELFGHEKGAFTGASSRRSGRFEAAHGGTLFLDEVGELPLGLQAKILRTLQEKKITPVGSDRSREVDVRVLAATNRDLAAMVKEGTFREDLYYRLNVLELEIPPLRQRKEDLPDLIRYFLEKYSFRPVRLAPEAEALLLRYSYPGNVRELEHLLQRLATLVRGSLIRPGDLPEVVQKGETLDEATLEGRVAELEQALLREALDACHGVQTRAAERLGISERVLRYKLEKYGIRSDKG